MKTSNGNRNGTMLDEVAQKADVVELMAAMGENAKAASAPLAVATSRQKNAALLAMAA